MLMPMRVFVVSEMAVGMKVRLTWLRQLPRRVGMRCQQVTWVVMAEPTLGCGGVGYQQAFAVMPAVTEQIIVLFTLGLLFLGCQAVPFPMGVLDELICDRLQGDGA